MATSIIMREKNGGNEENISMEKLKKARLFPSSRLTVTMMMFFGSIISTSFRMNIAFALVCMIKTNITRGSSANISRLEIENLTFFDTNYERETRNEDICKGISKEGDPDDDMIGEFEWGKPLQGALLGAIFYGNLITQVSAGWIADRYGGKTVLGLGLGVVSALNLAIPEVARFSPYAMLSLRIVQGMFLAIAFPATHSIISKWAPPMEIGILMNLAYSGMNVGTLVLFPLSGFICKQEFAGGWPSIFYVTGIMGIVYVIGLTFLVYDGYESHPRISLTEKRYLQKTLIGHHPVGKHIETPWVIFLKSGPVWAIVISHVSGNWGFYTLILTMPLFMKEVLKFDTQQNGFLSSLPNLCALIVKLAFVSIVDYTRRSTTLSFTAQRKLFNGIGMFLPAICLLAVTFLGCQQRYIAVGVFVACHGLTGIGVSGGYFCNHVDLSPQHAGTLMGISTAFATVPGILVPLIVGLLTPNGTKEEWTIIFYIATGFYVVGGAVYLLFGSGERQQWSFKDVDHNPQKDCLDNPIFTLADPHVLIMSHKKLSI